jgi:cold-inducible RNA-binding protein
MAVRLFVGNLPYDTTEAELREHFAPAGALTQVFLPVDRETGRPRGFAFVEFPDGTQAEEAIRRFNSQPFKGRTIAVNEARARDAARPPMSGPPPPRHFEPRTDSVDSGPVERPRGDGARRAGWSDAKPPRGRGPNRNQNRFDKPKGPIREKARGQLFTTEGDDDGPDPDIDNFATRAPDSALDEDE